MAILSSVNLKTEQNFQKAIKAYRIISLLSEKELETLEIFSNQKERDLILRGIEESKNNQIHPIKSIL